MAQLERPSPLAPVHAVAALSSAENVVFGGDMCWRDGTDRPFAWSAWQEPY